MGTFEYWYPTVSAYNFRRTCAYWTLGAQNVEMLRLPRPVSTSYVHECPWTSMVHDYESFLFCFRPGEDLFQARWGYKGSLLFDLLKQLVIPDQSSKDWSPFCVNLSMISIKTYRHRPHRRYLSAGRITWSFQFHPIPAKHEAELRLRGASSSCGSRCLNYIGMILQSGWSDLAWCSEVLNFTTSFRMFRWLCSFQLQTQMICMRIVCPQFFYTCAFSSGDGRTCFRCFNENTGGHIWSQHIATHCNHGCNVWRCVAIKCVLPYFHWNIWNMFDHLQRRMHMCKRIVDKLCAYRSSGFAVGMNKAI